VLPLSKGRSQYRRGVWGGRRVSPGLFLLAHLEYALVRVLFALLRALKPATASTLAGRVARTIGPLLPVSRVADENLRAAMPGLDRAARRAVVRGVWENLGRTMGELPHLGDLRETAYGPGFEVQGGEYLRALAAAGGPAMMASAHIGNWEMLPVICAAYGVRAGSLYRAAANPLVDAAIMALRQRAMDPAGGVVPMFAKGAAGGRAAAAHLARGGYLGLLMDQKLNDGIEARLFGLPAMTAPAAAAFALHFRCPLLTGHVERLGPARLRLVVGPPLPVPETGSRRGDILALTQRLNDEFERWIRDRPESWLWLHRRWPKDVVQRAITVTSTAATS
jgi:KDO2-lipid IV(A) lauroyltransferase